MEFTICEGKQTINKYMSVYNTTDGAKFYGGK